jgi:hypothetical protein
MLAKNKLEKWYWSDDNPLLHRALLETGRNSRYVQQPIVFPTESNQSF